MLVEIYSDVVCPWCAIGKARFERALADFPGRDDVEVVWRAFQLDPSAGPTPTPVIDGYARKFGGPERARQIIDHVTTTAAAEGITFHMDRALRANTFDAHRLLWWALHEHGAEAQHSLKAALLKAYFEDGGNVADHAQLVALAGSVGLPTADATELLDSALGVTEVRQEIDGAVERGVSAVPTFVIDGEWSVPGAQEPETFLRVFERLAERRRERAAAAALADGAACAVDDPSC